MPNELLYMRQMFGDIAPNYGQTALLVGLLLALLYRPERITSAPLFRAACLVLAVSIAVPPVLSFLVVMVVNFMSGTSFGRGGDPVGPVLLSLVSAVGPVTLGISIVLGLFSLLPKREKQTTYAPPKHPLE